MSAGNFILRRFFLVLIILALGHSVYAQSTEQGSLSVDSLEFNLRPYGSFRGHYALYNDEIEFQENASRVGFELGLTRNKIHFFAHIELGMNLFKSNSQFNTDGNSAGGFLVAEKEQSSQVFSSRLGFLGLDFGKWGRLSFGKQWSVYYDVTSVTDKFNVFGGRGSASYVAGTDGGGSGTGRADQSMIYRNDIGPVAFGIQLQARNAFNGEFVDGFGANAQVTLFQGLKAGIVFNRIYLNDTFFKELAVLGLDGQPTYWSLGLSYAGKNLILGAVYADHSNGDFTTGNLTLPELGGIAPTVVFDAYGFELFARYQYRKLVFLAGYNHYQPDMEEIQKPQGQLPVSENYGVKDLILGLEYRPFRIAYFYSELRLANGYGPLGIPTPDVLTLGLRIEADHNFHKVLKL